MTLASKRTSPKIPFNNLRLRPNIKIKDINWQPKRRTSIRDVYNTRNMALHWRTTQQQVNLIIRVPVTPQVLDNTQAGLAVGDSCVEVVLLAMLVDREALEVDVAAWTELGFDGTRNVDGRLHVQLLHALLHDGELDGDYASLGTEVSRLIGLLLRLMTYHLDSSTKGDLSITLTEMQVSD